MPLFKGAQNIRRNVTLLVNEPVQSVSREKAIHTIAKNKNISYDEAKFYQAQKIAISQARKR